MTLNKVANGKGKMLTIYETKSQILINRFDSL